MPMFENFMRNEKLILTFYQLASPVKEKILEHGQTDKLHADKKKKKKRI